MSKKITIKDIFSDQVSIKKGNGNYKTNCPSCEATIEQSSERGGALELYIETDTCYCHSSGKWFNLKESYAMKKGIIRCIEGRESK